jgi:5-methyltetrahydrofolate--homocysteine methyltransferase
MIENIYNAILTGNLYDIEEIVQQQLSAGKTAEECLETMMAGLDETGERFDRDEYFVPELIMAGDAFKAGMEVIKPYLAEGARKYSGIVVLGTIEGDIHDIGKNLVGFMLESNGFKVIDLGVNVSAEKFIDAIVSESADILAMSALLTTTMLGMEGVIKEMENRKIRSGVKVIIGGAPVSKKFAEDIRVDSYGVSAPQCVQIAKNWMGY